MGLGQIDSATLANSVYNTSGAGQTGKANQTGRSNQTEKASSQYGKTVGDPKLSEEGAKYYEELKSKYSDMEFVLVSQDKVDQAEALAAKFANPNKTIVLVDEEKIEKMATDEEYRKKYEGIIENANSKLDELAASLDKSGLSGNVLGFGMQVKDDGTTSYFAVLKDSSKAQKARIEKMAAEKKEAKKVADKKAQKKAAEKALEERRKAGRDDDLRTKGDDTAVIRGDVSGAEKEEGLTTVSANSIEELVQKISDTVISQMSDNVRTPQEMQVGQNFDMKW